MRFWDEPLVTAGMSARPEATLLLIDDSEAELDMLSRRLRRRGFQVVTTVVSEDPLPLIAAQGVDVVVLDLMTPAMGGIEVLRRLRSEADSAHLPVILVTAKSSDAASALDQGADVYVTKPIDIEGLVARIRSLLRRASSVSVPRPVPEPPRPAAPPLAVREPMVSGGMMLSVPADSSDQLVPENHVGVSSILDNRYRLDALIDSGGFGCVYRGVDLQSGAAVAVKVLHAHLMSSPQIVRRFQIEGISGCRIRHPNAVAILDTGTTIGGTPYLVMELLEGVTVEQELKRHGAMPFARCAAIIGQVCDVLGHAHSTGVLHRDIKPANIHLSRTAAGERVKVLDFGLAKLLEGDAETYVSSGETIIGTPQFMAPERLLGKPADGRADIYSVGVTLYLMMTGSLPFAESEESLLSRAIMQIHTPPIFIQRLRPDIPDELAVLIMRILARSRRERPTLSEIKQLTAEWARRWAEPWPPQSGEGLRSPLEIGETRKLETGAADTSPTAETPPNAIPAISFDKKTPV